MYGLEVEMKNKTMSFNEATGIQQFDWNTVNLSVNQRPDWMKNIPERITQGVYASGSSANGIPYYDPMNGSGNVVLSIELVRYGTDGKANFKIDTYSAISAPNSSGLLVLGPFKHPEEHWTANIPDRFKNAITIPQQKDGDL
jgi:hypothetical protein